MKQGLSVLFGVTAFVLAGVGYAFFDEVAQLRRELTIWETTHAADFTDVIGQLQDIAGPVFSDVNAEDWFSPYVTALAEWEIVSGYRDASGTPTGTFAPANPVTIAEALKMTMEAANVEEEACKGELRHADVVHHWADDYVRCAEQNGVRLFQTPSVDLDRHATRAEVLTLLHDAFDDTVLNLYSNFDDTSGHPYESDIALAAFSGIVSGDKNASGMQSGRFRPDDAINRAEVAKIIYERMKQTVVAGM